MNLGTLIVSGNKFRMPCVYEFLIDDRIVYVGSSKTGFARAFRGYASHTNDRRSVIFKSVEQIRVTVYDNPKEAKAEEIRLIKLHSPVYNKHYNRRSIW